MNHKWLCSKFVFIIFSLQNVTWIEAEEKVPYKTSLLSVKPYCNKSLTFGPLVKDPPFYHYEIYNDSKSNYIRGNTVYKRSFPAIKLVGEQLYFEDGKWRVTYRVPGLGCERGIFRLLATLFQIRVNFATCTLQKGHYEFSGLSFDYALHHWQPLAEPGRLMMRAGIVSRRSTVHCTEIEAVVHRA